MADEELWHVRLSSNEVKVLTLDQLDDLFRLEVIEADALVWQPGMDEWLPLNVVAGLGDEEDEPAAVSIQVSSPPPAPRVGNTTAVGWPPAPGTPLSQRPAAPPLSQRPLPPAPVPLSQRPLPPAPLSQRPAPAPLSQRPAPPLSQRPVPPAPVPLSQRPAPPPLSQRPLPPAPAPYSERPAPPPLSQRPVPPSPHARGSSFPPQSWVDPKPVANVSPFGATALAQPLAPYAESSTAPSVADISLRPRARSGGKFVIALALAAGAAVTLYRNAVVHAAAQSMGQEKSYLQLETALGGPAFGTPRAVDRMTEARRALVSAAAEAPPAAPSLPTPKPEEPAEKAPEPVAAEPAKTAAPRAVAAPSPRPAAASPVVRTSSRSEPDPLLTTPKKSKKSGKASEYDPLNGNL